MPENTQQVRLLLKKIRLSDGLGDAQLDRVASFASQVQMQEGESLHMEGKDCPFFIIISGNVRYTQRTKGNDGDSYVLKQGDFFGADVVFHGKPRIFDLKAIRPAVIISIQVEPLRSLLNTTPGFTKNIKKQLAWYKLVHSKPFNWIGEEETVKLICRKHPAYLFVTEVLPIALAWAGILVLFLARLISTTSFRLVAGWSGAGVVGVAIFWAIWRFFDWQNDFYIITDERIVWLERTVGLYDSRQEAPLVAIKAGETKSSQLGRWLGYGDVITQTFMGQIFFQHIKNPAEIKNKIDLERRLAMERQVATDIHTIEGTIRQKIEPSQAVTVPTAVKDPVKVTAQKAAQETKMITEPTSFWQSLVASFQTRWEAGGVITYRKHLYVLFRMTLFPAACCLGIIFGTGLVYYWSVTGQIELLNPGLILLLGIGMAVMAVIWWLYRFVDWSNDIYRVTSEKIIDSERKPLGDEITKSAPLENIIGLDYERLGFLGVVLNFGNVIINVGTDNKFIFYGIHNPARAQRDIFNYMYERRRQKQKTDTMQEQERVSSYIAAYHRQVEEIRQSPKEPPQS